MKNTYKIIRKYNLQTLYYIEERRGHFQLEIECRTRIYKPAYFRDILRTNIESKQSIHITVYYKKKMDKNDRPQKTETPLTAQKSQCWIKESVHELI